MDLYPKQHLWIDKKKIEGNQNNSSINGKFSIFSYFIKIFNPFNKIPPNSFLDLRIGFFSLR